MTQISHALQSTDLSEAPATLHRIRDVDVLRALAGAAISSVRYRPGRGARRESNQLGIAMLEARHGAAGDGPDATRLYKAAVAAVMGAIDGASDGTRLSRYGMAQRIVYEMLMDRCMDCVEGIRPVVVHEATDRLQECVCETCAGTGLPRVSHRSRRRAAMVTAEVYNAGVGALYIEIMAEAGAAEIDAYGEMRGRLRRPREVLVAA